MRFRTNIKKMNVILTPESNYDTKSVKKSVILTLTGVVWICWVFIDTQKDKHWCNFDNYKCDFDISSVFLTRKVSFQQVKVSFS
jgi:hypothetical protein